MRISRTGECNTGVTLLELIAVLFILSVVTAFVLPSFSGFGTSALKSEAREIASLLNYLNDSAISRKETFFIKFRLDENAIVWQEPDGTKSKQVQDMTGVTTQSTGKVSTGEVIVFFEPLGIRENLAVHLLKGDREMTVTLNHISGKVKIKEDGRA